MRIDRSFVPVILIVVFVSIYGVMLLTSPLRELIPVDTKTATITSVLGNLLTPVFSFITLLILLLTTADSKQEKNFQQTLDLSNRLIDLYANSLEQYQTIGKKRTFFAKQGDGISLVTGIIKPYINTPAPLFKVVVSHLKGSSFSILQKNALVGILVAQLQPIVEDMTSELIEWQQQTNILLAPEEAILKEQIRTLEELVTTQ